MGEQPFRPGLFKVDSLKGKEDCEMNQKFNLLEELADNERAKVLRERCAHIHRVVYPNAYEGLLCSKFHHNSKENTLSFSVEHWPNKFNPDYSVMMTVPLSFITENLSDYYILEEWRKLHPDEFQEVETNGIPEAKNFMVRRPAGIETTIRYHILPKDCSKPDGIVDHGLVFKFNGDVVDAVNAWVDCNRNNIMNGDVPIMDSFCRGWKTRRIRKETK